MQFDDFIAEIEAEALAEGPDAVAGLEAFQAHFAEVRAAHLLHRLERVVRRTYAPHWLTTPNPALDGDTPIQRIASGDATSVERLVSGLEDPGAC